MGRDGVVIPKDRSEEVSKEQTKQIKKYACTVDEWPKHKSKMCIH